MSSLQRVTATGLGALLALAGCASTAEEEDTTDAAEESAAEVLQSGLEEETNISEDAMPEEQRNIGRDSAPFQGGPGYGGPGFSGPWVPGGQFYCDPRFDPRCRGGVWGWRQGRYGREWGWRWPHRGGWGWSGCDPRFDPRCRGQRWY